ncbi:hypothetical protein AGOR_G00235560 [Albula goreensis]|uniref:RING-type domain-containing protein n=1 Tax=Albula goreensis TaxID=1534307 RepID=A0A8T3CMM3_9TELE|nr:hypothetical protein AGOR_G00235560 [Albula goreensis]
MRGTPPKTTDGSENGKKGEGNSLGDPDREDDRCPICLTPLDPQDQATPESCDHLFCLRCILTWGQTVPSCPVDRRPFSVIYKLDANLGTVKIPVKQKTSQVELLTGCCEKKREETKSCTSSRRPVEKTQQGTLCAEAKEHPTRKCKSPGSKCNQENSDLRKRKLMDLCGSQLLGPRITSLHPEGGTTAALTHCYEELFREDYGDSTVMQKNCRLELQNWPWVYATAAIPASHLSLRPCSRYELSPRTLPFRPSSSRCNSAAGRQTRCFDFPVAECIITCTRGGESKAPRPSSSRASKNQTETSTAKRSTRNSRSEESRPAPDAALSLSHESGSDSPTVDSARQGVASRPQQKRAGKRNTKQRAEHGGGRGGSRLRNPTAAQRTAGPNSRRRKRSRKKQTTALGLTSQGTKMQIQTQVPLTSIPIRKT